MQSSLRNILWGYPLPELMDVCATGMKRMLDAFVPLVEEDGRVIAVTSGLGPLMHSSEIDIPCLPFLVSTLDVCIVEH